MELFKPFVVATIALFIIDLIFPNVSFSSWPVIGIAGVVLTFTRRIVKPVLSVLLLPLNVITLGFFSTVVNVLLLWLITAVVPGFHIDPMSIGGVPLNYFTTLLLFSFLISLVQTLINQVW